MEAIKNNKSDGNEKLLKYKEIFDELSNERMGKIPNVGEQTDFSNPTYYFQSKKITPINFIGFRGPMHIYNNIKNGNTSVEKTEEDKKQFKSRLSKITTRNLKHNSKDQLNTIENIRNLYNSKEKVIKLYNDYAKTKFKAMYKTKYETGLKILTP